MNILLQYSFRNTKVEGEVEFVQNIVKSLRSTRSDYLLTGRDKAEGKIMLSYAQTCVTYCTFSILYNLKNI